MQVSGLNPEFGEALKALGVAGPSAASGGEAGSGGMWREVCGLLSWDQGDPPFLGRLPGDRAPDSLRPRGWYLGGRGSLTPSSSLG